MTSQKTAEKESKALVSVYVLLKSTTLFFYFFFFSGIHKTVMKIMNEMKELAKSKEIIFSVYIVSNS